MSFLILSYLACRVGRQVAPRPGGLFSRECPEWASVQRWAGGVSLACQELWQTASGGHTHSLEAPHPDARPHWPLIP